jgi:hypothetical protein
VAGLLWLGRDGKTLNCGATVRVSALALWRAGWGTRRGDPPGLKLHSGGADTEGNEGLSCGPLT